MQKQCYEKDFKLGVLGGGQLGRMMIQEAINLNISVHTLDPDAHAPCSEISNSFTHGSLTDYDTVMAFGADKDVLTIEIEHVNVKALEDLEAQGVKVYPQPSVLKMVQDKGIQKKFFIDNDIPTAPFRLVKNKKEVEGLRSEFPFMQKMRTGGYDGKGVTPLRNEDDLKNAFDAPSVLESFVDFETELSVIVARNASGEVRTFPTVAMEFNKEANLVEYLYSPAPIDSSVEQKAQEVAKDLAEKAGITGILAVEMFLTKNGEILVNEIAPRTHNSGHQTIEGNITSQFEQHLRAILDLPLGSTAIIQPSVMVNLLGEKGHTGDAYYEGLNDILKMEGAYVHLYGKKTTKPFRKMGHATVINPSLEQAVSLAQSITQTLKIKTN